MVDVILDIKKWGNNLGVRLPAVIAKEAHLYTDQKVRIEVVKNQVIITPVIDESLTLQQRLEQYDKNKHSGESMIVSEDVGAEKW